MNALLKSCAALGLLAGWGAAAPAHAAKPRTPLMQCLAECRKHRQACVKANKPGAACFAENKACYKKCRKAGAK